MKQNWAKDQPDAISYFKDEFTKDGRNTIDEFFIHDANVHFEQLSDQCFMLIVDNDKHHWHFNIYSRSGRAIIEASLLEGDEEC